MAAEPLSSPILRQDPPDKLVKRTARVATGVINTIRVPHDRFSDRTGEWYATGGTPRVIEGNQVKFLIDGNEAFEAMVEAMRTAKKKGDFIYMVNWFCDVDFHLLKFDEPPLKGALTNLRGLLTEASKRNVMIRAMFWKAPSELFPIPGLSFLPIGKKLDKLVHQNESAVDFLNSVERRITPAGPLKLPVKEPLVNAAAIHDQRGNEPLLPLPFLEFIPRSTGSQHQKFLCVFGNQGLVCFCGGIDFNPDRIFEDPDDPEKTSGGNPLHDVHCRIVGPAALELVNLFVLKWGDHPESQAIDRRKGRLIVPSVPQENGDHVVKIGRTFGKIGYRNIAPERTAPDMIEHAIRNAKRFIYTECQYFTGDPVALGGDGKLELALEDALTRIKHLTIVLTHWEISDLPTVNLHRRAFIQRLKAAGGDKVRVFSLQPGGNTFGFQDGQVAHTYVHAKIWIMDDEFAVIGSVNSNRRSWSHDAEVAAGIYEPSTDLVLRYRLAHKMRIALWEEHLNMQTPEGSAELADGVASGVHWLDLPPSARVRPYDPDERNRNNKNDIAPNLGEGTWNSKLDPA